MTNRLCPTTTRRSAFMPFSIASPATWDSVLILHEQRNKAAERFANAITGQPSDTSHPFRTALRLVDHACDRQRRSLVQRGQARARLLDAEAWTGSVRVAAEYALMAPGADRD